MGGSARASAAAVISDTLILRPARAADLSSVAAIESACFRADPWPLESFEAFLDRSNVSFVLAEDRAREGTVAGYAILLSAADEAELLNLAVAHDHRRKGVGKALLRHVLETAANSGIRRVYLEVRDSNAAARSLYALYGFIEVGRRRRYYERPAEDALILQRASP